MDLVSIYGPFLFLFFKGRGTKTFSSLTTNLDFLQTILIRSDLYLVFILLPSDFNFYYIHCFFLIFIFLVANYYYIFILFVAA